MENGAVVKDQTIDLRRKKKELWCLFGLALSNVALKRAIYMKTAQKYCGYCSFSWDFTSR